jgi:hypothetical protein
MGKAQVSRSFLWYHMASGGATRDRSNAEPASTPGSERRAERPDVAALKPTQPCGHGYNLPSQIECGREPRKSSRDRAGLRGRSSQAGRRSSQLLIPWSRGMHCHSHKEHRVLRLRLLLGEHGAADGHDGGDDAVDPLG